jgi:hypothetical protein
MNVMKATYLGYTFRTGVGMSLHLHKPDSCRLRHVSGYALTRFGCGGFAVLQKGPPMPLNIVRVRPILNMV